jgi:hypothetical protein
LVLSLLAHGLLLSVSIGGQSLGMPGFTFPWEARRLQADGLNVRLAPALPPAPAPVAAARAPVGNVVAPSTRAARVPEASTPAPAAAHEQIAAAAPPKVVLAVPAERVKAEDPVQPPVVPPEPSARDVEQARQTEILAQAQREARRQEQLRRDVALAEQAAQQAAARQESARQDAARQEAERQALAEQDASKQKTAKQEAAHIEAARLEAAKQALAEREAARQDQARQEAARQEAARQEAARIEAARLEAAKQALAEREAAQQQATRQDQARQEAARVEAARLEAAKQALAEREAARQEAARHEAAQQEAARQELAKKEQALAERAAQEAAREDRLRQIGKQLDLERAQRDNAVNRPADAPLPAASSLRRGWLFGRADPNGDLVSYAEAMSRKIELNMTFDTVRELVKKPHAQPTVTVAVRADGSVEKVTFELSSGVPALDEAIRKVIAGQAPYGRFPPSLARQYDVIEIRRTWIFDSAIRLQ